MLKKFLPFTKKYLSFRWKILIGFSIAFLLGYLITMNIFTAAVDITVGEHIQDDLTQVLEAVSENVNVDMLIELANEGEVNDEGFSDDERYIELINFLDFTHQINPHAWPYLYIASENENEIIGVVDLWAIYDPSISWGFLERYTSNSGTIILGLSEKVYRSVDHPAVRKLKLFAISIESIFPRFASLLYKLSDWTAEIGIFPMREFGVYSDQYGRWASGYMPISNDFGENVAAVGVDIQADHLNHATNAVHLDVRRIFLISFPFFLIIIALLIDFFTKPLRKLTEVTNSIADGNYQVDFSRILKKSFPDEIDSLAYDFKKMADKVGKREKTLKRIVNNLHDEVIGRLNIIAVNLEDEGVSSNISEIILSIRNIMANIRPPLLNYGLYIAIDQLVEDLQALHIPNLSIEFGVSNSLARVDEDVEEQIYYFIFQSCENTIKHAKATNLSITGSIQSNEIFFEIKDNGIGFELEEDYYGRSFYPPSNPENLGLLGLVERARSIGAKYDIKSKIGQGTTINIHWISN